MHLALYFHFMLLTMSCKLKYGRWVAMRAVNVVIILLADHQGQVSQGIMQVSVLQIPAETMETKMLGDVKRPRETCGCFADTLHTERCWHIWA